MRVRWPLGEIDAGGSWLLSHPRPARPPVDMRSFVFPAPSGRRLKQSCGRWRERYDAGDLATE